ncbi:hypothetical protein D3C71_1810030 [compost metagenome]
MDELRATAQPTQRQAAAAQAEATDIEAREPAAHPDTSPAKAQAEGGNPAQDSASAIPASQEEQASSQQAELPGADDDPGLDPAKIEHQIQSAKSIDVLDLASDSIDGVNDLGERARLHKLYQSRRVSMTADQQQARPAGTTRRRMAAPE